MRKTIIITIIIIIIIIILIIIIITIIMTYKTDRMTDSKIKRFWLWPGLYAKKYILLKVKSFPG